MLDFIITLCMIAGPVAALIIGATLLGIAIGRIRV